MRHFAVVQELAFRPAPPRTQMDFVDRHRPMQPVGSFAVRPAIPHRARRSYRFWHDGGGAGPHFKLLAVGVRLQQDRAAVAVADFKLVQIAGAEVRNEQFPDAAAAAHPHLVNPSVPAVEAADDADPFGAGRPYCEQDAGDSVRWCGCAPRKR
jgi:hypothetical protein